MSFGNIIRERRENLNMTQEELSYLIQEDLSRQSVSKWERGEAYPDVEKLLRMSMVLNVSLDKLFEDELDELSKDESFSCYLEQLHGKDSVKHLLKKSRRKEKVTTELTVKNEFPLNFKEGSSSLQITGIRAFIKRSSEKSFLLNLFFEGVILETWEDNDLVKYKLIDSDGGVVKTDYFNINANIKGERFKSSTLILLPYSVGDCCKIELPEKEPLVEKQEDITKLKKMLDNIGS